MERKILNINNLKEKYGNIYRYNIKLTKEMHFGRLNSVKHKEIISLIV